MKKVYIITISAGFTLFLLFTNIVLGLEIWKSLLISFMLTDVYVFVAVNIERFIAWLKKRNQKR